MCLSGGFVVVSELGLFEMAENFKNNCGKKSTERSLTTHTSVKERV